MAVADLERLLATRTRSKFLYRINFDWSTDVSDMVKWCENNCRGRWNHQTYNACYFQFEDENDAFMFKLKFGAS